MIRHNLGHSNLAIDTTTTKLLRRFYVFSTNLIQSCSWCNRASLCGFNSSNSCFKGGIISEGIFNFISSSKKPKKDCPSTLIFRLKSWGAVTSFYLRMRHRTHFSAPEGVQMCEIVTDVSRSHFCSHICALDCTQTPASAHVFSRKWGRTIEPFCCKKWQKSPCQETGLGR